MTKHTPKSSTDRITPVALALFGLFTLFQIVTFVATQRYFPDGFWTENFYHPLAVNLLHYGVYGLGDTPNIEPSTMRPPFYTAVLAGFYALFGEREVVGVVLNNVFLNLTLVLTYVIGRRLSPAIGLIAAGVIAFDTIYLAEANRNQSDMLFTFLVVLGIWLTVRAADQPLRWSAVAAAGLVFAVATFTRAAGMYLSVALVLVLVFAHWRTESLVRLGAAALIVGTLTAAFMAPWMARNYAITGNAQFASMKGYHLVGFYAPLFIAKRDGITPAAAKKQLLESFQNDPVYQAMSPGQQEKYLAELGGHLVRENWWHALLVIPDNIPRMFLSFASESLAVLFPRDRFQVWAESNGADLAAGLTNRTPSGTLALVQSYLQSGLGPIVAYGAMVKGVNTLVLALAALGCLLLVLSPDAERRSVGVTIVLVCGALSATALLATQGRFRLPVMPGLAVAAGFALYRLRQWYGSWRDGRTGRLV